MKRILVVLVALTVAATACGGNEKESITPARSFEPGTYMAKLQDRGRVTFGVKFDVPQFGFRNPTTDKVEGFDVDLAREVAEDLGVTPRFVEAISKNRLPFLLEGKVDVVFSTMTITEDRKKQIDFSDVYYVARQSFLTRKGESMTVETAAGKKVCTAKGSTSELNLPVVQKRVQMVLQDGYAQCVQLLRNKQVDAVSTDDVILLQFLKQSPDDFTLSKETFSTEPYGAGIKKGNPEFTAFVGEVIKRVKRDGTWTRLYRKWIAPVTEKEPPDPPSNDVKYSIEGLEAPVTPSPSPASS